MAHDKRGAHAAAGPFVPGIDMDIGAADSRFKDADEDLIAPGRWAFNRGEIHPRTGVGLDERVHVLVHDSGSLFSIVNERNPGGQLRAV